jgi:Helix-turn-helix domain
MSWKALDWATESDIRSPTTKFVLHLLANKADEEFSCYPSIRTLMAESGAGRSTVMRALQELQAEGFITRRPQFHESGAQRSTRYYLNHPQAPHRAPRPTAGPHGGPKSGPLEPPIRTTNRTSIRRHQDAGRAAGSLAGWQEGCRNPDTRRRGRASVGLDPPDPHPTHRTQTRRRPKPRTGPGSTPRRPTPSAPTLLPANHRVVRRLRRRTITHHHHRHARRHRSSRVLPPLQPASPTKSTGPSPCAKEVNSIGKQHL